MTDRPQSGNPLNALGEFFKQVGTLGKDIAGAALAQPKFIWDVATAPWNDAEEFNGFTNTLKNAGGNWLTSTLRPVSDVAAMPGVQPAFQKLNDVTYSYVQRPLSTFALASQAKMGDPFSQFKPSTWQDAWNATDIGGVTSGQAITKGIMDAVNGRQLNVYDKAERDRVYRDSLFGKSLSGITDAVVTVGLDPLNLAGPAIKGIKASNAVTNALESADDVVEAARGIRAAASGIETNKYTTWLDRLAEGDSMYAYNDAAVKSSSAPGLLAHAFGQAKTREDAAEVALAAIGDREALDALRLRRPDLGDALDKAQGRVTRLQALKLGSAPDGAQASLFPWEDAELLAAEQANLKAIRANYKWVDDLLTMADTNPGGTLTRTVGGSGVQAVNDFLAKGRSLRFYQEGRNSKRWLSAPTVEYFQPTPFHTLYQRVSWAENERPAGLVDLNDANSIHEVVAFVNRGLNLADKKVNRMASHVRLEDGVYKFTDDKGVEHAYQALTDEKARGLIDSYMAAATPEERSFAVMNIENEVLKAVAGKHGISLADRDAFYAAYMAKRKSALQSMKDYGFGIDADGSVIMVPQIESQTADFLPLMDVDKLDSLLWRRGTRPAMQAAATAGESLVHTADVLNDMFKLGALMRLGYTVRNGIEAQLRIAATTSAVGALDALPGGARHFFTNRRSGAVRLVDSVTGVATQESYQRAKASYATLRDEVADLRTRIDRLGADEAAEKAVLTTTLEQKQTLLEAYSSVMKRAKGENTGKARLAQGKISIESAFPQLDGSTAYMVDDAFGGNLGDMWAQTISADATYATMINDNATIVGRNMVNNGFGAVTPDDPHYWTEWARTLSHQLRNSPIMRQFAEGNSTSDVAAWLRSAKGAPTRKALHILPDEVDEYVLRAAKFAQDHVGNDELKALLLSDGPITADMVRKASETLPRLNPIHGHTIAENLENLSTPLWRKATTGIMRMLGSMPEDAWARNPLYAKLYRDALRKRVNMFEGIQERALTSDELWSVQKAAHQDALTGVKSILFNVDRKTNAAYLLRMIAPFFSAYENSIKFWGKTVLDNPAIANRAYGVFTMPNRVTVTDPGTGEQVPMATDKDGNPVPITEASMDDVMWFQVPKWMKSLPFVGEGLSSLDQVGVAKRSLDVIFGGDFQIPVGPYVAMPLSAIVKDRPDLEESLAWALPFGPTPGLSSMLPTWLRRQMVKNQGQDNATYANFYNLIWQTEMQKAQEAGVKGPSAAEIKKMTDAYFNMHSVANLVLPFAPRFNTPYRFYIDEYHKMQQQYGYEAGDRFWAKYGDQFYRFTTSLSKNTTGAQASVDAVLRSKKYSSLIGEVVNIEPKLIGAMVNNPNGYDFSAAAYQWQGETPVAPGSSVKFRDKNDPAAAEKANRAQLGWQQFREGMDAINAVMQARGLASLSQSGAEDLAELKTLMVNRIGRTNTAWADDYMDTDGSKTQRAIRGLTAIVNDKRFMRDNGDNPTWKSVAVYLSMRSQMQQLLRMRPEKSLEAKSNSDLAEIWGLMVTRLANEDEGFRDIQERFLSQDGVYDKFAG